MNKEIRVLILEDVQADASLIREELQRGGLSVWAKRVETKDDYMAELRHQPPDLILSDHGLPSFDGFTALSLAKQYCPDTPFIFVTGARGEEVAIQTFESGATDYVLKNQLYNLIPAVKRALYEAEQREKLRYAEEERERLIEELKEALVKFQALDGLTSICTSCKGIRDESGHWHRLEVYLLHHSGAHVEAGLCPECARRTRQTQDSPSSNAEGSG